MMPLPRVSLYNDMECDLLYFAYGSNLNAQELTRWCEKKGYPYPLGEKVANAYLPDARLIFNYYSPGRQGGMLNIKYQVGQIAPGALFKVLPGGWTVLDAKGTDESMYKHLNTITLTEDGREHVAVAYQVAGADTSGNFVQPHPDYVDIVREGLKANGIDDTFLTTLAEGHAPPYEANRLFVYGNFLKGGRGHTFLADLADLSSRVEAKASGLLYDSGAGFPCMTPDEPGGHFVAGELYILEDFKKAFERLDYIDLAKRHRKRGIFFRRAIVRAIMPDGQTCLAWSYLVDASVRGMPQIASGSWRHVRP